VSDDRYCGTNPFWSQIRVRDSTTDFQTPFRERERERERERDSEMVVYVAANQEPVNVKLRTTRTDEDRDDETVHQSEVGSHTLNPDVEARDRLHKLEESLKAVAARGSPEQGNDEQSIVLNTEGVAGHEVINLLQKYAHQMHQKMQQTGDVSFDDHGDHHMHKHDQSHKHEGHDSHVHQHHTNGHSHDSHVHQSHGNRHSHHHHVHHSHENVDKKTPFRLPEEIEEERDLQEYGFEGRAHSDVEYNSHFENWDFGTSYIFL